MQENFGPYAKSQFREDMRAIIITRQALVMPSVALYTKINYLSMFSLMCANMLSSGHPLGHDDPLFIVRRMVHV